MALINCPQCGHMISDKAKACPKCGYVLNNEQAKPVENIDDEESESQFDDCTPQQGGGLKWILIVLAILVIGGGVGYYFYADNKAKKEIALAAEQARLDSIEAARLDSIRQDSIERASFTSPDLSFHDLHGDVKRCDNENYESLKDPYSKGTYSFITFDENGRWTNVPQWSAYSKKLCPETTKHPLFERNNKGYIIRRFWGLCDSDGGSIDYIWKDGKLIHNQDEVYSNDGLLISDNSDAEGYVFHTTYYNYKVDGIGNWVKRDYVTSTSYGSGEIESYEFGTETRKITYYKSDGGKLISIPNNAKQEQAVKTAKAFNKTKEQENNNRKGPEWINGIWELNTTVTTAMGRIRVNAKLCIDRESQQLVATDCGSTVAKGSYYVSDNTIHCGDTYFDIEPSSQRIDYGNGNYFRKVSNSYLSGSNSNSSYRPSSNVGSVSFHTPKP